MFNRPDYPTHQQLIDARDHLVAKHPNLRVVGAHLGSLEYDVDEVAARLDRYPNFAVDISARLVDLVVQPTDKVRNFFIRYADRVLFGTDVVMRERPSVMTPDDREDALDQLRTMYATHFSYFEQGGEITARGRSTMGLNLPSDILQQFYVHSAQAWYPGL
jgi:hypothetical protein